MCKSNPKPAQTFVDEQVNISIPHYRWNMDSYASTEPKKPYHRSRIFILLLFGQISRSQPSQLRAVRIICTTAFTQHSRKWFPLVTRKGRIRTRTPQVFPIRGNFSCSSEFFRRRPCDKLILNVMSTWDICWVTCGLGSIGSLCSSKKHSIDHQSKLRRICNHKSLKSSSTDKVSRV